MDLAGTVDENRSYYDGRPLDIMSRRRSHLKTIKEENENVSPNITSINDDLKEAKKHLNRLELLLLGTESALQSSPNQESKKENLPKNQISKSEKTSRSVNKSSEKNRQLVLTDFSVSSVNREQALKLFSGNNDYLSTAKVIRDPVPRKVVTYSMHVIPKENSRKKSFVTEDRTPIEKKLKRGPRSIKHLETLELSYSELERSSVMSSIDDEEDYDEKSLDLATIKRLGDIEISGFTTSKVTSGCFKPSSRATKKIAEFKMQVS